MCLYPDPSQGYSPMKTLASRGLLTFSLRNSPIVRPEIDIAHFVMIFKILPSGWTRLNNSFAIQPLVTA